MDLEKIIESNLNSYKRNIPDLYFISRSSSDQIPYEYLNNARASHGIDKSYRIYFMMSNGAMFSNCKCSLLILQDGVSMSYGDPFSGYESNFIDWNSIQDIKLITENSNESIIFYFDINYLENNYKYTVYNANASIVVELLKAISRDVIKESNKEQEKIDELHNKAIEFKNKKEYKKAFATIEKALTLSPGNFYLKTTKAEILLFLDKHDESLKEINECIEIANSNENYPIEQFNEKDKNYLSQLKYFEGQIYENKKDCINSIFAFEESYSYSTDKEAKENIINKISAVSKEISTEIENIDYKKRKLIFCNENILTQKPSNFLALSTDCLSKIKFPLGHPINGELYVGHPYKSDIYYHYNDYERQLFQDKVMEISFILECLGAKTIKVEYLKGDFKNSNKKEDTEIQGSASFIKGINGEYKNNTKEEKETIIGDKMISSQHFSPTIAPFLPDDLLWYNHEITWQRLVNQRLNGSITNSSITISSKDLSIINSNEITKVNAELKALILKAKGSYNKEKNIEIKTEQLTEWKIDVEFAPKNVLINNQKQLIQKKNINNDNFTENEKEYFEFYNDCIKEGEVNLQTRRILERLKNKLNITDERIKEIETIADQKLNFTIAEREYLGEVNFCLDDDGMISPEERRFLDKLKTKLNISDERVKLIETFAKSKK